MIGLFIDHRRHEHHLLINHSQKPVPDRQGIDQMHLLERYNDLQLPNVRGILLEQPTKSRQTHREVVFGVGNGLV